MQWRRWMGSFHLLLISAFIETKAQTAEWYIGHQRTGMDIMWFRFFEAKPDQQKRWLYFSRNRASVDYHQSPVLWGSTNALSYQFKNGFGLVTVGQFTTQGLIAKAGVQYTTRKDHFLFFGWLVTDLQKKGQIDLFGMFRFQPPYGKKIKGFHQLEIFPVWQRGLQRWNLTERIRTGLQLNKWATGWMLDMNQTGKKSFSFSENTGLFVRYEF